MRRSSLFLYCLAGMILASGEAFAQFTTRNAPPQQSSAGTAQTPRFTRTTSNTAANSAPKPASSAPVSFTRSSSANSARQAAPANTARSVNGGRTQAAPNVKASPKSAARTNANRPSAMTDDDMPDFSAVDSAAKDARNMSPAQKIILLEEYATRKQKEREAMKLAEERRKAAIAKKIAEETPSPGMMFDENGVERPVPKGELWVYVTDFTSNGSQCSLTLRLQNRTNVKLENLRLMFYWPSDSTYWNLSDVAPNAIVSKERTFFSDNCPSLRVKPRLETQKCVLGPAKAEACANFVVLK